MTRWRLLAANSTHLFYAYGVIAYNLALFFAVGPPTASLLEYAWWLNMAVSLLGGVLIVTGVARQIVSRAVTQIGRFGILSGYRFMFFSSAGYFLVVLAAWLTGNGDFGGLVASKLVVSVPAALMELGQIAYFKRLYYGEESRCGH